MAQPGFGYEFDERLIFSLFSWKRRILRGPHNNLEIHLCIGHLYYYALVALFWSDIKYLRRFLMYLRKPTTGANSSGTSSRGVL